MARKILITVVDASLQEGSVLLQLAKLVETEERVVDAVRFSRPGWSRRHGNRAKIQIIPDRRLQLMVHRTFGEASRQVLAKILG